MHQLPSLRHPNRFWSLQAGLLLMTLILNLPSSLHAQAPGFRWAKKGAGTADEVGNGVAVDGGGNNYVVGYFKSASVTFGATVLTTTGGADLFLAKYNFAGTLLWAKKAGGTADDFGNGVALDGAGNIYVTGYFLSTNATFGGTVLTNTGSADIFVAKYDSAGTLLWAKKAGGNGYDAANGIDVDAAGNSYVTGFF